MDSASDWGREINTRIVEPIDLLIAKRHFAAAVILILSGIDAMANVNRTNPDVSTANNFRTWVRCYFHLEGQTTITPDEWWEARNAIVHTFGAYSVAHRRGKGVRVLGWICCGSVPPILDDETKSREVVLVDVKAMRDVFAEGVTRFLEDAFGNPVRERLTVSRLNDLLKGVTVT